MIQQLRKIYTKDYLLLILIGFIPLIYKISQLTFLSTFDNAMNIIGQMVFVEIIFKIFQETLINPLFKMLGNNNAYYAKKLLVLYILACAVFTFTVFLCVEPIMRVSRVPLEIYDFSKSFLKLMTFANGINVIVQYLFTLNLINKSNRSILAYFLISSIGTLLLNIVLVPKFTCGMGVNGLAISYIIVYFLQLVYFVATMPKTSDQNHAFNKRGYVKLCAISFLESAIRNLTYYFVILVMLNALNNQDLYFISNEFIWSVMLIPTLAQNNLIKQKVAQDSQDNLRKYFLNNIIIIGFMSLAIPLALIIFKYIFCFQNYMEYFLTLLKLWPCYIIYIFDNVIESYFIAVGKLNYVFAQTFITSVVVYLTSFILYTLGIWNISLNGIIVVFSLGMILSSTYTICVYITQKNIATHSGDHI